MIDRQPITGWEIWFQVEFSIFLEMHPAIASWDREFQYSIDKRKARHRQHMAIDFVFRKKHSAREQYIALEVKQNSNVKSCIRGMMEDACKVSLVKTSCDDLRSMWAVGIHPQFYDFELLQVIGEYAYKFDVELHESCIFTNPIKKTKLAYTVF